MIFEDIIKEGYKYMVKNIMGGVVAIALAFGASTNITTTHANLQHKSENLHRQKILKRLHHLII